MRKLLLLFMLFAAPLAAQNPTAVSGTITDPNGVAYFPATVTACLTPVTTDPIVNGQHVNQQIGSNYCAPLANTSPTGFFSLSLFPNSAITPASTQWRFTVTTLGAAPPAGKGPQTFQSSITISGSSQDVGATLTAASLALLNSGGGGITSVSSIPATCTPGTTAPVTLSVSPFGIYYCVATNVWSSSSADAGVVDPTSFGGRFNVNFAYGTQSTIGITNLSNIVTCNNCNFLTTARVGQTFFANNGCCNPAAALGDSTLLGETTISQIDSNTQLRTVANATATCGASNCQMAWGDYEDASISAAEVVWQSGQKCRTFQLPAGAGFVKQSHFSNPGATCIAAEPAVDNTSSVLGQGLGASLLVPTPTFNFASCTGGTTANICFGGYVEEDFRNWSLYGMGTTATGNNAKIMIGMGIGSFLTNVNCVSFGGNDASLIGIQLNFSRGIFLTSDACGKTDIQTAQQSYCYYCFGGDSPGPSLEVQSGTFYDYGGQYGATTGTQLILISGGEYHGIGSTKFSGPATNGTCVIVTGNNVSLFLENSTVANCTATTQNGIFTTQTGLKIFAHDSTIGGTASIMNVPASAKFFDGCNNTFTGVDANFSGTYYGSCSISGTTLVAGNVILSAGWGTTATVTAPSGDSRRFSFTANSSGTGQAANPTMTVTFPLAFVGSVPQGFNCKQVGGTGALTVISGESTTTKTTMALTFNGTPVAGSTYIVNCGTP